MRGEWLRIDELDGYLVELRAVAAENLERVRDDREEA